MWPLFHLHCTPFKHTVPSDLSPPLALLARVQSQDLNLKDPGPTQVSHLGSPSSKALLGPLVVTSVASKVVTFCLSHAGISSWAQQQWFPLSPWCLLVFLCV